MAIDFNFMVGGEAGQGVQSVGAVLGKAMMRGGFSVFADQDYASRIRGGHNFFRVRASDKDVRTLSENVDILLALNKETIDLHQGEMKPSGIAIFDQEKIKAPQQDHFLDIPLERLAMETTGNKVMTNSVAMGAALGLIEYDFGLLAGVLKDEFGRHGEKIVEANVKAAQAGYDYAREHRPAGFVQRVKPIGPAGKLLMTGHEAVGFGALVAGCKFVAGYPMTPTTSVIEYFSEKGAPYGVVFVQPEDEISAMNMVVGAAYAGARAMTATSGGGFCLMVEGLSLAGMTETPVVVILGQRPGPAIGLPTRTEQGELWFALHAGHGEFPRAVFAPATVEDCFWQTIKAFNLAEKYQTPVIIITDTYLANSYNTVAKFDLGQVKIDRGQLLSEEEVNRISEYKRHQFTDSGISPRAIPLQGNALVVTDSDEHNEEGHIIEDGETRTKMVLKRMRKLEGLRTEIGKPRVHQKANAEITLVGWGSTYGSILEAADILQQDGITANILHLNELWPFPEAAVSAALSDHSKSFVVESNATGQLASLIRRETGIKVNGNILSFDGRPISPQYIVNQLKREVA